MPFDRKFTAVPAGPLKVSPRYFVMSVTAPATAESATYIHGCTEALGRNGTIERGLPLKPVATSFKPIVEFHT